jgi:translation initiation factor 2 beta subunit (eIF-2beta)/eIF-5
MNNSFDVECPYCGAGNDIVHDDNYGYREDELYQQQCSKCDNYFTFTTTIHFYYDVEKADCLNGGEHQYEKTKTFPREYAKMRCKDCGDEQPIKEVSRV